MSSVIFVALRALIGKNEGRGRGCRGRGRECRGSRCRGRGGGVVGVGVEGEGVEGVGVVGVEGEGEGTRAERHTCLRLYNSGRRINFFNLSLSRTFFSSGPKLGYNRSGKRISGLQSILNLESFSLGRGRSMKIDCMPPPGHIYEVDG